jgi:hypothetical protein
MRRADWAALMSPRRLAYALLAVIVSILGVGFGVILYATHIDSESNRRWCGVVSTLDNAYSQYVPTTPLGQELAREIKQLRNDFGC